MWVGAKERGGNFSAKEFFQGSGAQENLKGFKLKAKHKDARTFFKFLNFKDQTAISMVSSPRSIENGEEEGAERYTLPDSEEEDASVAVVREASLKNSQVDAGSWNAGAKAGGRYSIGSFDGKEPAEFKGVELPRLRKTDVKGRACEAGSLEVRSWFSGG